MRLDTILIAITVLSMFTIGMGGFISELTGRYGTELDPEFNDQFNKFNTTYSLAESITEDIKEAKVDKDDNDDWNPLETIRSALNSIKTVFLDGIPAIFGLLTGLGDYMPLPEWAIRGIQTISIISLAFALIYLYFRYQNV